MKCIQQRAHELRASESVPEVHGEHRASIFAMKITKLMKGNRISQSHYGSLPSPDPKGVCGLIQENAQPFSVLPSY